MTMTRMRVMAMMMVMVMMERKVAVKMHIIMNMIFAKRTAVMIGTAWDVKTTMLARAVVMITSM